MVKRPRLLVVEDDADAAEIVRSLLKLYGYTCEVLTCAEDALERITASPDKVAGMIVDFQLPGIDGMELTRRVRLSRVDPAIKVIGTTAYHTPELRAAALDSGFDAFLAKPLNVSEFARLVSQVISKR